MKKILLLGDSITEVFPPDLGPDGTVIINKGISGNNTEDVYNRLDEVVSEKPDMVFLLIGTNDFAQGKSNMEIGENIFKILQKLKMSLPAAELFAVSILPVRDLDSRPNSRIIEVNKDLKKIAEKLDLNYFDLHFHFVDSSGKLKKEFTEDGLHLTRKAYLAWNEILKDFLSERK